MKLNVGADRDPLVQVSWTDDPVISPRDTLQLWSRYVPRKERSGLLDQRKG